MSPRGAGYLFGSDVVKNFCDTNGIEMITRAHQLVCLVLGILELRRKIYEECVLRKSTLKFKRNNLNLSLPFPTIWEA